MPSIFLNNRKKLIYIAETAKITYRMHIFFGFANNCLTGCKSYDRRGSSFSLEIPLGYDFISTPKYFRRKGWKIYPLYWNSKIKKHYNYFNVYVLWKPEAGASKG